MWCTEGLEFIEDLSQWEVEHAQWEKQEAWDILKDGARSPEPKGPPLNMLLMRARVNSQRQYEVYTFTTAGLSEKIVREQFERDPQFMADFIRVNGYKIYSDYAPREGQRIS
jgi:hypothetical protein